jgi:N-[(2S)-2-amino-2-carboxyethyl]-L-glutamate dehydrogenase
VTGQDGSISFRYLSQEEVIALGGLDMAQAVDDIEEVFRLHALGDYVLPSKVVLRWGDLDSETTRGRINAMPGYIGGRFDMAGMKWIASFPANIDAGLPRGTGVTILNDPRTGVPLAVMDGTLISAVRTGAVSGVAARHLARRDARTIGIIGAGVQSRTQLMAVHVARPALEKVLVFDVRPERAAAWCADMRARLALDFSVVDSARAAIESADVLVTATTATEPIVMPGWVPAGCLYLQVAGRECHPDAIPEFDRIVVDNWTEIKHRAAQALVHALEVGTITDADISAELGEIVVGAKPGRTSAQERIYFSSVGMGIEDVAIATRILRQANASDAGSILDLWRAPVFM